MRCGGSAGWRAIELEDDRAGRRTVALPQQARVLLRRTAPRRRELRLCGFHAPAGGNRGRADRATACSPPSAATSPARWPCAGAASRVSRAWERGGAAAARTASAGTARRRRRTGARACATWSCAKAGARASCRCASSRTEGELEAGLLAAALSEALGEELSGRAVDALAPPGGDDRRRRDRARLGRGRAARAPRRARPADLLGGLLPDEHRDGRACSTGWSSSTPRSRAGSACTTCTAGSARSRSRWRRGRASCGGSSWSRRPSPTRSPGRSRNGITKAQFFAGDIRLALPELARSEPGARTSSSSTRPARASQRRWSTASSTPLPGASSTSPATPPRSPPTPPNWWRPAGVCARSARSTCSRRPTTSSAWRCSSGGPGAAAELR